MMTIMSILGGFFTLMGVFTMYHLLRRQHAPADRSNRINKIRLWWFALTREELFAQMRLPNGEKAFPWLERDELDNVS